MLIRIKNVRSSIYTSIGGFDAMLSHAKIGGYTDNNIFKIIEYNYHFVYKQIVYDHHKLYFTVLHKNNVIKLISGKRYNVEKEAKMDIHKLENNDIYLKDYLHVNNFIIKNTTLILNFDQI